MFNDYDEKNLKVDNYEFIFEEPDNGWWLKIDSAVKLIDYHKKTEKFYGDCLVDYIHNEEKDWTNRTRAIVMYGEKHHLTIIDAIIQFRLMIAQQQLERIHDEGAIYINSSGGYHSNAVYKQNIIQHELIFPNFTESDIKIERFPGGKHWYAYIGKLWIKNGDISKWNTYQEAYDYAKRFVSQKNKSICE